MRGVKSAALPVLFLLAGCDNRSAHVAGPFYLMAIDIEEQTALYRCPQGPKKDCVGDDLPGPTVFAAGADDKYVVAARHPRANEITDKKITQYFYFHRIPQETAEWWLHPEKIVGPLTEREFNAAKSTLHLPDFAIVRDDLK